MARMIWSMAVMVSVIACGQPSPAPATTPTVPATTGGAGSAGDRPFLLETIDDAAVVQLYADGFSDLPLKDKTLIWHLYQAAIAGRDIFYDQKLREQPRDA